MSTSSTRPDFSITFLCHPQAASHPKESMRELTNHGKRQLAAIVDKLHGYAFDTYRYTPTVRTTEVSLALISAGHDKSLFRITHDVYPDPDSHPQIWEMFTEIHGNAPMDYKNHLQYPHFKSHCGAAARILIPNTSRNILVIGHGTLSQQIAACICHHLGHSNLAEEIECIMMNECDQLKVSWKNGQLSWNFDPLGDIA